MTKYDAYFKFINNARHSEGEGMAIFGKSYGIVESDCEKLCTFLTSFLHEIINNGEFEKNHEIIACAYYYSCLKEVEDSFKNMMHPEQRNHQKSFCTVYRSDEDESYNVYWCFFMVELLRLFYAVTIEIHSEELHSEDYEERFFVDVYITHKYFTNADKIVVSEGFDKRLIK